MDTGTLDTGTFDTGTLNTGILDTGTLNTGALDTGTLDTGRGVNFVSFVEQYINNSAWMTTLTIHSNLLYQVF